MLQLKLLKVLWKIEVCLMEWYNNLYIGENAKKRKKRIITKIKLNRPQLGVYVITLPMNDRNALEFYPSNVILQKHYRKMNMTVVGIAIGKDEALILVQKILMDCYKQTGQFLVRKMIEENKLRK